MSFYPKKNRQALPQEGENRMDPPSGISETRGMGNLIDNRLAGGENAI